jgi:hypothetical protein
MYRLVPPARICTADCCEHGAGIPLRYLGLPTKPETHEDSARQGNAGARQSRLVHPRASNQQLFPLDSHPLLPCLNGQSLNVARSFLPRSLEMLPQPKCASRSSHSIVKVQPYCTKEGW